MHVACPRCDAVPEFAARPPAFCSQCGCALPPVDQLATAAYVPAQAPTSATPTSAGGYRLLRVDQQSDLYAVAATLSYLLAGRAPFQGGDAAAVLARTAADPVPPPRAYAGGRRSCCCRPTPRWRRAAPAGRFATAWPAPR